MSARLSPTTSPDTEFFWRGLREGRLLIQRCDECGALRHPPRPMCPSCTSLAWSTVDSTGRGTVHSFVIPRHPPDPFIEGPYIVAIVELEEGVRLVSNLRDVEVEHVHIGMAVEVFYETFDGDLVLHQLRPVTA